ncbi:MAG TPA: ATP synthase F1 subunit delta [Chitinophagaceae bacterium]|nr:ATP synthase F1 subunit delta [Chitinophagaceae bacterium]
MRNTLVGKRYAKALMDLAVEKNQLDAVNNDISLLKSSATKELNAVLSSPVIKEEKKSQIFNQIYKDKISNLTLLFFDLIFKKSREYAIADILNSFEEQYRKTKGIVVLNLTTAVEISDAEKEKLRNRFQQLPKFANKSVSISSKVDPKIIGGFVARLDDTLYDASIKHDLEFIGRNFIENMYVQKIR